MSQGQTGTPPPTAGPGRMCSRCAAPVQWATVRVVSPRVFCGEVCAITWLADEASRTAWARTALRMTRTPRSPRGLGRLLWARLAAAAAQWRLDRRLQAGPRAQALPWVWLPTRQGAGALALALLAWGAAGGPSPETRAMVPEGAPPTPAVASLSPPAPAVTPLPAEVPSPPLPAPPPAAVPVAPVKLQGPGPRLLPRPTAADISRGSTALRRVAFTFDGGDQANVAGEILDALQARGVRSTFFLTGQFIRLYPEIVGRMVAEGHEVGNHTDTHPRLTSYAETRRQTTLPTVSREFVQGQLRRTAESFRALTGRAMAPYWRAPYGEHNGEIRGWAAAAGFRHIGWTRGAGTAEDLDTRDWVADRSSRIYRSREEIAARILEFGRARGDGLSGGIVLMHLGTNRMADRPHESLPEILRALQAQGYRAVTVSEMLAEPAPAPPEGTAAGPNGAPAGG